ncbi:MAG: hypothetical protein HOP23_05275 [Methylococcaceae bacterium]|nr:hypothetical protein [Methylococcaceae bacterium]
MKYLFGLILLVGLSGCSSEACDKNIISILNPNETSAKLLMDYAKIQVCKAKSTENSGFTTANDEQKLILIYDLYVKARSYSILNKIFFWLSIIAAFMVFIWPSLGVVLKNTLTEEWYKSAVVQTTITGIAALMFALYSQYKDKQTYTENLMRYTVFSEQPARELAQKVIEEIGKIDNGFSFQSVTEEKGKTP